MMNTVFQIVPSAKQSLMQRWFKQEPIENAVIELNNLLAIDVLSVNGTQLREIESRYLFKFTSDFALNLEEFYAVYWNWYLKQKSIDRVIENELAHLVALFELSEEKVLDIQIKIGEVWYDSAVRACLVNRSLSAEDEGSLEQFRLRLRLPIKVADRIRDNITFDIFEKAITPILARQRCSPDEERDINALIGDLKIPQAKVSPKLSELKKFKYYWQLEHLPLKVLPTDPALQKSETLFLRVGQVKWNEIRGSGNYKQYELINQGTLFLTNKRLVFSGNVKNSIITYDKISRITVDAKGVTVFKDKGKDPVLTFNDNKVVFEIVFKRLLREFR